MTIGGTTSDMYINYRSAGISTPSGYVWNAGTPSTYANHIMGNITSK